MRIIIVKDGEEKFYLPNAEIKSDGTIWQNGIPLINADLLDQPNGITKADAIIASKSGDFAALEGVIMVVGDNGNNKTALADAEIDAWKKARAQKALRAEEQAQVKLDKIIPGIKDLMEAREGEAADYEAMSAAIERGDGFCPANKYTGPSAEVLAKRYPDAARYLQAKSWSYASHFEKSAAGSAAVKAMEAGENAEETITKMESEWSTAAARCVANS